MKEVALGVVEAGEVEMFLEVALLGAVGNLCFRNIRSRRRLMSFFHFKDKRGTAGTGCVYFCGRRFGLFLRHG